VEFQELFSENGSPFLGIFEMTTDCANPVPVAGGDCVMGDTPPMPIVAGAEYLIAFGSGGGEGPFTFDIKVNEAPINDDPCLPDFEPYVLEQDVAFPDDNSCATPDFAHCNLTPTYGKTLFYEYTMEQDGDLQITVNGITAGGPFTIAGYETSVGCNDPGNFLSENCGDNVLVIPCLEAGDVVIILIGTGEEAGQYGEFEVTVDEIYPDRPDNDECDDAQEIEYLDEDLCKWKGPEINENNVNACSEYSDFGTGCNFDSEEVIWFEFTAPPSTAPNSSLSLQFLDYTGTGEIFAAVFYYSEDCTDLIPVSPCVTGPGPHGDLATVQPGETYLIGVGSNGDLGGDFDIEIKITTGPPNDDPCADLTAYDLSGGTTLLDQTNLCSDPDGIFPECDAKDQENAVIYQFEIVEPYYGIQITVTANANGDTPLTGTVVGGISETNSTFCGGLTQTPPAYCEDISNATFVFDCLPEGTYQLKISTSDANSGDFDISSTMLERASSCDDTNNYDYCEDAAENVIEPLVACEPYTVNGCNDDACPEDFIIGSCDFTTAPTVWYTFISLPGATSMNITNLTGADDGAFLVVFEGDCDNLTAVSPCIVVGQDELEIPIEENTLYFIAIGNTNGAGGSFEFDLTINVTLELVADPPQQDLCSGGAVNIQVMIEDGLANNDIQITYIDNPNVEGETELLLTGGSGYINNVLTLNNDNCDVEEVVYIAEIVEEESNCAGDPIYIYVYVYPEPTLQQPEIAGSCFPSDQQYDLLTLLDCEGYPGSYEFEWEATDNGLSGNSSVITLDGSFGPGLHNFSVTITDELGCSNVDELELEIYPLVHFNLESPTLCYSDDPIYLCPVFDEPGTPDYYYQWDFDCLNVSDDGDCFLINPAEIDEICGPGTHDLTLVVTDQNGCYFELTTTVTIIGAADFSIYPYEPQICENAAGTEVCLTLYDNTDVDYVEWVTPDNESIISTVPDYCAFLEDIGDYTVYLYDENGCVTSYDFYVDYNLLDDIEIDGDEFICLGESAVLSVAGDYVDYNWSTGETTPTITVTPTANTTYTVNVTDQNGCVGSTDILVTVVNTVIETLPDSASFCTGYYTQISAGGGYDTYTWYKGSVGSTVIGTSETITVAVEDWYFVEVTSMGCPALDSIYVSDNSELSPSVLIENVQLCYEDESTLVIAIGGIFEYYTWIDTGAEPDVVVYEGAGLDSVYLPEGQYELIVEDQLCSGSKQFEIVKLPPVEVEIQPGSDTIDICYGDYIDLYVPEGFEKYEWNTGTFNDTLYNVDHGLYIVTVTDENGCEGVDSVFVRELPAVDPDLGNTREICEGDIIDLSPGNGFSTYVWYLDGTHVPGWDNQSTISVDEGGLYHVEVTNHIGCLAEDSVLVNKTENLDPIVIGDEEFCLGSSLILQADKDYFKYTWVNESGEVIGNGKSIEVFEAGTFTLMVETATGCTGEAVTSVTAHVPPGAQVSDDIIFACGANSTSGSSILDFTDFIVTDDPGEWADADNSGVIINGGWNDVDFSQVLPGTYTFVFTTTNAVAPCPNVSDFLTVIVEECNCQTFTITAINDLCNEGSVAFDLNDYIVTDPAGIDFSGSWKLIDGPGSNPLNGSTFDPVGATDGSYTLEFTLDDSEDWCEETQQTVVKIVASPVIGKEADRPEFCKGTEAVVELESLIEGEDIGGAWAALSPITGNAFDPVNGTFNTMDQAVGVYRFEYLLTGENPCGDKSLIVEVEINPLPLADAGPSAFGCYGDVIELGGNSSNGNEYVYEWKDASGNIVSTDRYFLGEKSGTYTILVKNTVTGCLSSDNTELEIFNDYVPTLSGKNILVDGETGSITVTVENLDQDEIEEYIWYKDNDLIPGESGDVIYVNEAGTYCVEIIPRGDKEQACIETACITIGVKLTKEVYIPNIFTPNGDGYNDDFHVVSGKNVQRITNLSIYDRWGELVFQTGGFALSDSEYFAWDGYFRGAPAMQGVYVYKVDVLYNDDTSETIAGDLTLIR
jgi:gliding motility-associated-like protein